MKGIKIPVITLELLEQTKEKKIEITKKITKLVSELTVIPENQIIVFIKENSTDNVSVGGTLLSEITKKGK